MNKENEAIEKIIDDISKRLPGKVLQYIIDNKLTVYDEDYPELYKKVMGYDYVEDVK